MLVALFVLALFAYITYKTPLAGDDWGYYINGGKDNPITMALNFYNSWSGRFFSELWGMIMPRNKWLWNIVNPLLFFGIFIAVYKLGYIKNKYITIPLFILAFMLSVKDNLRMETYTWIMGTTYVVPLFLSLLYFLVLDQLFSKNLYDTKLKIFAYLDNILLFIIGLMMENIAGAMILGIIIAIIYGYFVKKKTLKYLIINLVFSTVSFIIMRSSPGSASRLLEQNADWNTMSIIEKISTTYPTFLKMSFINNPYAISLFSIVLILLVIFTKKDISKTYKVISSIVSLLGIITVFSFIYKETFLTNETSLYSSIFWPIYIINAIITIYLSIEDTYRRDKALYLLIIGGSSVLAMLFSPIFGARSSLYLIYYLIVVAIIVLDEVKLDKKYLITLFILFIVIIIDRTHEYIYKYRLVGIYQSEREQIIDYYINNPDEQEAWITRFPIYTIHGIDVEDDDTYHMQVFKQYYNLPQDKIVFYNKETN